MSNNTPDGFKLLAKLAPSWKGEYEEGTTYYYLDEVTYRGSSFIALKDTPTCPPVADNRNWRYQALRGERGPKGEDGHTPTKEEWGLDKVENADIETILSRITIELLESILGVKNLKEVLEHILDDAVTGITGPGSDEFQKGNVTLDKTFIGLSKVDNLSSVELIDLVREQVKARELNGIEIVSPQDNRTIYAAESETSETLNLELIEDLHELITLFKGENGPGPGLVSTEALLPFLEKFYKHYTHRTFLEEYHPVLGVRGEFEEFERSDHVVITRKSLHLDKVPNAHPDSFGSGFSFYGQCINASRDQVKTIRVERNFSLRTGRRITVDFKKTNRAFPLYFNVNNTGKREVWINNKRVTESSARVLKSGGSYTFVFEQNRWKLISANTSPKERLTVTLARENFRGSGPYYYSINIDNLHGDEDFQINAILPLTEMERANFELINLEGESQSNRGIVLRAEELPHCDLDIEIIIGR